MEEKKINSTKGAAKWKEVLVGGVSGIALGSAGTLFASAIPTEAAAEESQPSETQEGEIVTPGTVPMATKVTDSMSFGDAFNIARSEVGAGGVFEWHGNLYGTFTVDEWNNMDDAAREQYAETIHWNAPSHEYAASNNHSHSSNATHENHTEEHHTLTNTTNTTNSNTPGKNDEEPDVEIIGIEHVNIDGEHDSIIGTASVNGQNVYFVDIDGEDDEFEIMISDTNGNAQVDQGEAVDISEQHMSVSHFEQLAQSTHENSHEEEPVQYYANNDNLPDYVNDADPGALA